MHEKPTVVLFDGVCSLCNSVVDFVMRNERTGEVTFAALQSESARELLDARVGPEKSQQLRAATPEAESGDPGTVVFIEGEHVSVRSTAVLRLGRYLRWPWQAVRIGWILPRFVRDALYDFISKHRYAWFGKKESCRIPTPEERARFLT